MVISSELPLMPEFCLAFERFGVTRRFLFHEQRISAVVSCLQPSVLLQHQSMSGTQIRSRCMHTTTNYEVKLTE